MHGSNIKRGYTHLYQLRTNYRLLMNDLYEFYFNISLSCHIFLTFELYSGNSSSADFSSSKEFTGNTVSGEMDHFDFGDLVFFFILQSLEEHFIMRRMDRYLIFKCFPGIFHVVKNTQLQDISNIKVRLAFQKMIKNAFNFILKKFFLLPRCLNFCLDFLGMQKKQLDCKDKVNLKIYGVAASLRKNYNTHIA